MEIPTLHQEQETNQVRPNQPISFFDGGERGYLNELFVYMLGFANRPLLCLGEEGVGKTALLSQVHQALSASGRVCLLRAPLAQEGDDLAIELAQQFKINIGRGDSFNIDDLATRLLRLQKSGEHAVLLIDDAEQLSEQQLSLLARLFTTDDEPSISMLMMARTQAKSLQDHLGQQLRVFQLAPFDDEASEEYIRWRMSQLGLPLSSLPSISGLVAQSRGVAARIEALLYRGAEVRSVKAAPSGAGIGKKIAWALLVVVLALVLIFQEQINQVIVGEGEITSMGEQEEILPLPVKPRAGSPKEEQVLSALPNTEPTMVDLTEAKEKVAAEQLHADETPPPVERVEEPPAQPEEVVVSTPEDAVSVADELLPKPADLETKAEVGVTIAPPAQDQKPPLTAADESVKGTEWILAQDSAHYTFHVMSVRNEDNLKAYIKKSGITAEASYYKAIRKSGEWYVLLYGVYPDSKSAYSAHDQLVKQLKVKDAFVRSFKDIQQDITKSVN